ncbi:MAG: hypothetical protein FJ049_02610 [Cyanobacteria bacterium M_surface_7_m2_037]|nr:hypothetical protein [Cyanobacteria bacterium M_surface_7_m2_037]
MPTPGTFEALKAAKTIGSANLSAWGEGYNADEYLNVLPNPDQQLIMNDGWSQWQRGNNGHRKGKFSKTSRNGSYYSSWGPSKNLDVTLRMSTLDRQTIQGLGRIMANQDGGEFNSVYDTSFWQYNKQVAGPLLVANPGDHIRIRLINDLKVEQQIIEENPHAYKTNLHGHGLHVSPGGNSDNVLITLDPGETWDVSWKLPKNHMSGLNWSHPHYHGSTSLSIAKGLALPLVILPKSSEAKNAYDPTQEDFFLLTLQTWALAQQERAASPTDPLNQDPSGKSWTIGTPPKKYKDSNGEYYKYSPARFNGNNYYPVDKYNPAKPSTYGDGVGLMPNENAIHTVNGYYNPTLQVETGNWATFLFENFSLNSTHIIQLIRRDESGNLSLENTTILGTDGDLSHWVSPEQIDQLPLLMPGGRAGIQHAFKKPGDYFFISNASQEVLGDLAPVLSNVPIGDGSTYLGFNDGFQITPSQVLATVRVTGEELTEVPPQPKPWTSLYRQYDQSQALRAEVAENNVSRERQFDWLSGAPKGKEFNNPETWEGTWTINGQYWSHAADKQPTLTTTMLDTVERWRVRNLSAGRVTTNLSGSESYNVVGQSHPFHIHVNEFLIESINGLNVSSDPNLNQVGDSFYSTYLDNLLLGPRYLKGTATADNPYGTPGSNGSSDEPFVADLLLEFKDFPGLFMDHCHLLFHEDAGMMVAVQTILNTNSSWLVADSTANNNDITISLASDTKQAFSFSPYQRNGEDAGIKGINASSGDINADPRRFTSGANGNTVNVTDNIADIATLQKSLTKDSGSFSIHVYDGAALKRAWNRPNGNNPSPIWTIAPFKTINTTKRDATDLAVGDINGDGYDDIAASLGSRSRRGIVEIYSGEDRSLLARLTPFSRGKEKTAINLDIGDVNADGFADLLTGQGKGGRGRVEVFSGIKLYEQLKQAGGDPLTGQKATREALLFDDVFQPYGKTYKGAIDVAASYALPRGFDPNQIHQTPSANITTLKVGATGSATNPSIQNWLFTGGGHGEADHQSHDHAGHQASATSSVTYTSGYNTSTPYVALRAQYIDLPSGLRGQATLLGTTANGQQDILYLPDTAMQSGSRNTFDSTTTSWNPSLLG